MAYTGIHKISYLTMANRRFPLINLDDRNYRMPIKKNKTIVKLVVFPILFILIIFF
jgi:hypothetical protein